MKRAFTLVELLAVLSILSILLLVGTKTITTLVKQAKDNAYDTEVNTIKSALKMYASDNIMDLPDEGDTIYLTLYQLKEYGYLKDVTDFKKDQSFADDTLLSIEMQNSGPVYSIKEGTQINDFETVPDLYYDGKILDTVVLGNTYTLDNVIAKSYTNNDITSNITKKIYKVNSTGLDTEVSDLNFTKAANYKIVYTVTDSNNTVSIIKNINVVGELTFDKAIKLDNIALDPTANMFNTTNRGTDENINTSDDTNGFYKYQDNISTAYFFRGNIENNYVKFGKYPSAGQTVYKYGEHYFYNLTACQDYNGACKESNAVVRNNNADMYWRIIRINGDGTIRLLYSGTSVDALGQDTGIGISTYNPEKRDVKNMGYTFDRDTNETNSTVKTNVENWYDSYLLDNYDQYIATEQFVSDSSGYPYKNDYFNNYKRLHEDAVFIPQLDFKNTVFPNYGGIYNLKVGLITLDEAIMAGGKVFKNNDYYYLQNGNGISADGYRYWTMTPSDYSGDDNHVWWVLGDGEVENTESYGKLGMIRPVINLKTNLKVEGTGTSIDPYIIVE